MLTRGKATAVVLVAMAGALVLSLHAVGVFGSNAQPNAIHSFTTPWGTSKHIDPIGDTWSAGGIPLCTRDSRPVTLTSITPVVTYGQIHLDRIVVRRVHWHGRSAKTGPIGTYPGVPPGGRSAAGYVIPSPSPCRWRGNDPLYETVIAASRTGTRGGYIEGLRVRYQVGSSQGEYVIPFTYALCGTMRTGPCRV